jgi:hypothetical protein
MEEKIDEKDYVESEEIPPEKLNPVTCVQSHNGDYFGDNPAEQTLLLQALKVAKNPEEIKKMMGFRNTKEVFRTLDKLAMRKEYHQALSDAGMDLDWLVKSIKEDAMTAKNEGVRLDAKKTILKSLGLDRYEVMDGTGGQTWEDILLEEQKNKKLKSGTSEDVKLLENGEEEEWEDLEVELKGMSEEEKKKDEEEKRVGSGLYG